MSEIDKSWNETRDARGTASTQRVSQNQKLAISAPSNVLLVRLRWEDDADDFGVAVVPDEATLAEVRFAIAEQFKEENNAFREDYRFILDGSSITTAQEGLIRIPGTLSIALRSSGGMDIPRRTRYLTEDQIDISVNSRASSSNNDTEITIPLSVNQIGPYVATPSHMKMFPSRNPFPSSKIFIAKIHVSGQNIIETRDISVLLNFIEEAKAKKQERVVTWIDVQSSEVSELEQIGCSLELHPLTVEDISVERSRQKVEGFRQYMLVIFHGLPLPHENRDYFESLSMIVSSHLVLTIHHTDVQTLEYVRRRLEKTYIKEIPCTATLVHAIADCIVDYDTLIVDESVQEMDVLEDLVYMLSQSEQTDLLRRMGIVRKRLTLLRQSLWSRRDIITQLMSREWRQYLTGVRVAYFRDVLDHVLTMIQKLELAQAMLDSLQSTYMAKVSIEVSEASNNISLVMKNISSFATAFLPMTFITGLWGMNVKVPFQSGLNDGEAPTAFFIILASMFIGVIPFICVLKRLKWL